MVKNNINKFKRGFTLFEMVIVVGIISILTGMSFSYYGKYAEGKKLEGEARRFANALSLASKKTSSGEQGTCDSLIGYRVNIQSNTNYVLQGCCGTNWSCNPPIIDIIYTLPNNIAITTPLDNISFNKLGAGIIFNNDDSTQTATIKLKNKSLNTKKCIDIKINKAGVVDIGDRTDIGCP